MSTTTSLETLSSLETPLNEEDHMLAEVMPGNKAALFEALARAGITIVTVHFGGYGDEGQIESIEAYAGKIAVELPSEQIEISDTAANRFHYTVELSIENLVYEVLEESHGGWEINDGSYGEFTFDVKEGTITLGYNERYMESEYSEYVF